MEENRMGVGDPISGWEGLSEVGWDWSAGGRRESNARSWVVALVGRGGERPPVWRKHDQPGISVG